VTDRLLVDLDATPLNLPLGAAELEDLRWYLEDYLRAPYGVYETRGPRIADQLPAWGQAMFTALFGSGTARDDYIGLRMRGVRELELVLRSATAERLGMPWELLRDPQLPKPLALDGVGFTRTLPGEDRSDPFAVEGQKLRVLMVIARPRGAVDVGYQMIARPLLRRLAAVRGQVELAVLRPPTLEALESALRTAREAGDPFQIVHFDGHGRLTGSQGELHFERRNVPADQVAHVLNAARVPVVVLNACQSGALGKQLEAAVATQLLAGGAMAVVAMAYNVYAVAAAEFMTAFYERLFAGDTISDAVRAGRARLAERPGRRSPKGELPLEDWAVPVHYARSEVRFPQLRADPQHRPDRRDDTLKPAEQFVGRDSLFHALETAAGRHRVIVLHGPAGTGKTELAKAFGRWWRDTGGVDQPEWVLWHSFEPGAASSGLAGVISAIGLRIFGPDFVLNDPAHRFEQIQKLLHTNRFLLVWDNFESVAGTPAELKAFLDRIADGRSTILLTSRTKEDWLGNVHRVTVGGLTRDEAIEYADQLLAPLPSAADRRADRTFSELLEWLHGHPLSMRTILPYVETTDAATLLSGLRGTIPLPEVLGEDDRLRVSMTYSFTHLDPADRRLLPAVGLFDSVVAAGMLAALSKVAQIPRQFRDVDTDRWIAVLDRATHVGLLTALGEGGYGIHPALPAYLASLWRAEDPDAYPEDRAAAERALLDAYTAFGALMDRRIRTREAAGAYQLMGLHRRTMVHLLGYAVDNRLWAHAGTLFSALKEFWNRHGLTDESRAWVDRIMLAVRAPNEDPPPLGELSGKLWLLLVDTQAEDLIRAGQLDAAEATCTEALDLLMAQPQEARDRHSRARLCYQLGRMADQRGRRQDAEQWHRESLAIEEELGNRSGIARSLTELGAVARKWARWDEAEKWLNKALIVRKELGDQRGMALTFDQLGHLATDRGRWDEAANWFRRSLDTNDEVGDLDGRGRSYHELGRVAQRLGQLDTAAHWFEQSLVIAEQLHDPRARAASYNQLGLVALMRGRLDEAEQWLQQSLGITEVLQDRTRTASSYQALGTVALQRKQLDQAVRHLHQAIEIWQKLGDQRNVAASYNLLGLAMLQHGRLAEAEPYYRDGIAIGEALGDRTILAVAYVQLGTVVGARGDTDGALEWTIRSAALFEQVPHPSAMIAHHQLAALDRRFGRQVLAERWERITGGSLPDHLRNFLETNQSKEDS
jgi:tetratricopeptide (TPR) repeat protein